MNHSGLGVMIALLFFVSACSNTQKKESEALVSGVQIKTIQIEGGRYNINYEMDERLNRNEVIQFLKQGIKCKNSYLLNIGTNLMPLEPALRGEDIWALILSDMTSNDLNIFTSDNYVDRDMAIDKFINKL